MSFVHLHLHTQYSLLQGAIQTDQLFDRVAELGMPAVAMTDMHNLFGAIDFYEQARAKGIKPIIGCEVHWLPHGRQAPVPGQGPAPRPYHLVLLCKNLKGYQNLCQLVSASYLDAPPPQKGAPAGPRAVVDRALLEKYSEGLIALSGCLRGELVSRLIQGDESGALEAMQWLKRKFGEDFYVELQDAGIPEQDNANTRLAQWAHDSGIECVATVDCHYLRPKDAEAHEILQCIDCGKNLDFERPKSLVPPEFYLKSPDEMRARFERFPEAIANTLKVADKCDLQFRFKDDQGRPIYHLPVFRPEGVAKDAAFDVIEYFRSESQAGLRKRFASPAFAEKLAAPNWKELEPSYHARLEAELTMIARTGFASYFLIVADFIGWAKQRGIPVGPGRGSGAGSLVAYSLGITDLDPIQFNLLFERFINPERISMPDFDVDFCQERRGEVIEYVTQKYGSDNVAQIITFGKLQARAVLKDVGRVLGLSFADSDALTKLFPDTLGIELKDAYEIEPRLREKIESDARLKQVWEYALSLEGLYRNAGVHAAGIIITERPIVEYCALYVSKDGKEAGVVTQFDKDYAEKIGLVKFDFLGLKTLTVIDQAVKLIRESAEPGTLAAEFDIERIRYDDQAVYQLLGSGDTDGIFQVESSGMKDLCSRMLPGSLEDVTAINALYRPGPLGSGMVDDFIDRKHGRKELAYELPQLESILRDTYGVILYQEQVMQIARELGGYSLGQADLLRRAMGKKKPEEMAKHKEIFVKGAAERGIDAGKATAIFDLMAKFAEYGFNKSHSAAYGVITYQTAFLKRHYPVEFMAALMTTEMDNTDKITKYIGDARSHGVRVLPPDVNRSQKRFSVEVEGAGTTRTKAIRFGLEAIKGVGSIAVDTILESRAAEGPFKNAVDFCKRVSTRKVNKKVLESLTLAGAFDAIGEVNRASLFASLETLLSVAGDEQEERELGQNSLFDSFSAEEIRMVTPATAIFKQEEDWPLARKLQMEKQTVGFYVTGHPMDGWQRICEDWLGWHTEKIKTFVADKLAAQKSRPASAQAEQAPPWMQGEGGGGGGRFRAPKTEVKLGGLMGDFKEITTKKGSRMAFASIEDLRGKLEVVFFPEAFGQMQELLRRSVVEAEAVVLVGDVEISEDGPPKILAKSLAWARDAHQGRAQGVVLRLKPSELKGEQLLELKRSLNEHRGKCPVRIEFTDPGFSTSLALPKTVGVAPTPQMVSALNRIFGREVVKLT